VTPIRLERNISKTAGFRDSVPKDHQQEMASHMDYKMIMWTITLRDHWRCCEAVRSAILATAWLLVTIMVRLLWLCAVFCYMHM